MKMLPSIIIFVFLCTISGCAASLKTTQRGNVNAPMEKAVQDTKDALNTYGFDIQDTEVSSEKSRVTGKRASDQEAWVAIEPGAVSSSKVEVRVNRVGDDEVGADTIFDDIKARSQK